MLKSMTGFGRGEDTVNGLHIIFEVKSVNHKFFETNTRITRGFMFIEERLKAYLQSKLSRGKVDVFLQIEHMGDADVQVQINHSVAAGYYNALKELQDTYLLPDGPSLGILSRCPDVLSIRSTPEDEDAVWQDVLQVVEPTTASLMRMRENEGARLKEDIQSKARRVLEMISRIEQLAPDSVVQYRQRLKERIEELLGDNRFDEQRVLTEVAIFADKAAVDEELVRLRSHFAQLEKLVESQQPVGRKIDFLVQEMNREVNTIGSKSQNTEIAYLVVDIKSEIEKIREQVQNVE